MIKTIYILWFQGFNNAPYIVNECVNSWKHYNPTWNIVLLDNDNLKQYINIEDHIVNLKNKQIANTQLSDVVRSLLLNLYGGLWVDSTTFCNRSLDEWLPKYVNNGFFAFNKPAPDRMLSSWFLYSEKNGYIINKWCQSIVNYYNKHNNSSVYFIYHYLFGDLYNEDPKFKQIWDNVIKISANGFGPHFLLNKMFNQITNDIKYNINHKLTPVYKLTYKRDFPKFDKNKNVYYLVSTIK